MCGRSLTYSHPRRFPGLQPSTALTKVGAPTTESHHVIDSNPPLHIHASSATADPSTLDQPHPTSPGPDDDGETSISPDGAYGSTSVKVNANENSLGDTTMTTMTTQQTTMEPETTMMTKRLPPPALQLPQHQHQPHQQPETPSEEARSPTRKAEAVEPAVQLLGKARAKPQLASREEEVQPAAAGTQPPQPQQQSSTPESKSEVPTTPPARRQDRLMAPVRKAAVKVKGVLRLLRVEPGRTRETSTSSRIQTSSQARQSTGVASPSRDSGAAVGTGIQPSSSFLRRSSQTGAGVPTTSQSTRRTTSRIGAEIKTLWHRSLRASDLA